MPTVTCSDSEPTLSLVTTLYNSAPFVEEFCRRMCAEAAKITSRFELILVNDGSPDNVLDIALDLQAANPRIRVVDLARNFGQHKAMMTGLAHAEGDLVFLIDVDLEEDPALLGQFYQEMRAAGSDVVYGVQTARQGGWFRRVSGQLFYKLFSMLANFPIPQNPLNARLMTRRYVQHLLEHRERELYMAGLWALTGFKQTPLKVFKGYRGSSNYTFRRKLAMSIDAVVSFSNLPLAFIFYLGGAILVLSVLAAGYMIARRLMFREYVSGWASLIVSIWIIGGLTIFCLGIIAIYVSKIFIETKQRPYTIVRQAYEPAENAADGLRPGPVMRIHAK